MNFLKNFKNDVIQLMNVCNRHVCNPTCYKNDKDAQTKLCRYRYPASLISETHFDPETNLLHIKRTDKWLNYANPWIRSACRCNHDIKLIGTSGKDAKAIIYYIIDCITKSAIYTSHMYSLLQIVIQKIETIYDKQSCEESIDRSCLIKCLNTVGSQQEIFATTAISYLMNYLDRITNYDFTNIPW